MKTLFIGISVLVLLMGCTKNAEKTQIPKNVSVDYPQDSFISSHHMHEKTFGNLDFTTEKQWDSLRGISKEINSGNKYKLLSDYRTFGWHIYSNGSSYKNYNFSLLWGVSYFAYLVDPETGSYKNIHQWKTTKLIDSAKAHNCKVFLTVSNFGSKSNAVFLKNPKAQERLIDSVASLLVLRDANGVNIDFEGISSKNKEDFTKFIRTISQKLKQKNPDYMVSLCLYAIDWHKIFDIKVLNPYIDFYTLMGYDYYGSFSTYAGPVSPLKSSKRFGRGLESSVNYYINDGVQPKKLIVGLPYYGAEWSTESQTVPSKAKKFISHPPYKAIRRVDIDSLKIPVQFEKESASSYSVIKKEDGSLRQLWFEDRHSLSIKYDWIKSRKIGGVGIWALGYDNGFPELWELLGDKFAEEN